MITSCTVFLRLLHYTESKHLGKWLSEKNGRGSRFVGLRCISPFKSNIVLERDREYATQNLWAEAKAPWIHPS